MGSNTSGETKDLRKITLGEFVRLQRGYDLPAAARREGSIPIMGSAGISGYHEEAIANGPGVTIVRSGVGSMGVVCFSPVDFWPHNTTLFVTDFLGNDPRFAYYLLQTIDFRKYNSGSAQASLNRNNIYSIEMDVPDPAQQQAIARIFGCLDDKIELNRQMNETLEAMARAMFRSWFVDIDPVRAKVDGRQPDGMDAATAGLFPDKFEDSPLGPVPMGWRVGKFYEVVTLSRDGINPGDYLNEVFDHYSIPAFDEGRMATMETGAAIKSNKFAVRREAVLLSKLNPRIERVWLPFPDSTRRSVCSTEFLVLYAKAPFSREFLAGLVSSTPFQDVFITLVTGTSGSHQWVQPDSLLKMDTVIPEKEVVGRFARFNHPIQARIAGNTKESVDLAAVRDALLPKLLSGELQILSAETLIGATL